MEELINAWRNAIERNTNLNFLVELRQNIGNIDLTNATQEESDAISQILTVLDSFDQSDNNRPFAK